ncbi:MAG: hypothetical protein RL156_1720 [Bacteroidota bacterium]|jgi:hypothetical protein
MENKLLMLLTSRLEERRTQLIESLADGAVKDHSEYRYLCGTIRGLAFAQSEIEDLVRKLRDFDDE